MQWLQNMRMQSKKIKYYLITFFILFHPTNNWFFLLTQSIVNFFFGKFNNRKVNKILMNLLKISFLLNYLKTVGLSLWKERWELISLTIKSMSLYIQKSLLVISSFQNNCCCNLDTLKIVASMSLFIGTC